jgi:hypothetical protein
MEETPSIEKSFHIDKLLDYLPIIIIGVIFLVGFFTWDVVRKEMASFMMLILVFIYALWVMVGNSTSYRIWVGETSVDQYIIPPLQPGEEPFKEKIGWFVFGIIVLIAGGLVLGFISITINDNPYTPDKMSLDALTGVGSMFSIGGIVLVLYSLWKIFGNKNDESSSHVEVDSDKTMTKRLGLGGFLGSVLGFYMIARARIIDQEQKDVVGDSVKEEEYKKNPAKNGANTALVIGLILQVIGYALVAFGLYAYGKFNYDAGGVAWGVKGFFIVAFFLCGILWIAKSQNWPGFDTDTNPIDSFMNNVFAAHGGIYMIFAVIFLVLTIGALKKSTTHFSFGVVLVFLFLGCYGWNIADMTRQQSKDEITKEQTQILREEVTKELKKNAVVGTEVTDEMINDAVVTRIRANQKPSEIVNGVFMTLSVVIILLITVFRTVRLRMGICGGLPEEGHFFSTVFNLWKPPSSPDDATGYCDNLKKDPGAFPNTSKTKAFEKITKGQIDNVTGTEWDALLNTYDDTTNKFDKNIVRTAKGAMWNPFLLVILIVSWVAIVFARVSTSEATNMWIAHSFTGDMFPKVKELIDTFFIVLIVGLLLCGILLLPMVKELNVGGLDSMLRFAESIQVWQYNSKDGESIGRGKTAFVFLGFLLICVVGLSWWWDHLRTKDGEAPVIPKGWEWAIALVVIFAFCSIPGLYHLINRSDVADAFKNESGIARIIRLLFTAIYLIPWLFVTVFKVILFAIPGIFSETMREKRDAELEKFAFWNWKADKIDLRLFPIGDAIKPESVTSMAEQDYSEKAQKEINEAANDDAAAPAATAAKKTMDETLKKTHETLDQTKVSAIGKLIKAILLTISFVILILTVIYYVYKVGSTNITAEQEAASGGFVAQLNSPTAQVIYVIMAIVAVAGVVAYIREKFTVANTKTPEEYLFDDYKPEDTTSPMRQLTFGLTHIIYVVLMIIVWVYDTEKQPDAGGNMRMSVTGMTVLGLAILFFHYFLEFIDNKQPAAPTSPSDRKAEDGHTSKMAPLSKLLTNIRFIVNTIFFIVLCVLAYYKQHAVMVILIIVMFLFHLTKSILGMKLLRLIWLSIIYIPCLFLGLLTTSQGAIGDTTRPIWLILAIEIVLIAILYGGPYLINYIGASNSQIIAAPVPLRPINDTGLTTQSPQIFIFHNTGLDRSDDDKAANCEPEEKKRYNYSVSGWFWINTSVNPTNKDLEIFNFGGVPRLTYNQHTTEFKVLCNTVDLSTGLSSPTEMVVYNSRFNFQNTKDLSEKEKTKFDILNDSRSTDAQLPIQKWNYFVINYNGKTMDVFLNNTLVAKSDFFIPDIMMKPITSGDDGGDKAKPQGLIGNICNVTFHKDPMTLEQIRWTYTMLKDSDPPMVGMTTIADEVKTTGSTNIYSQ